MEGKRIIKITKGEIVFEAKRNDLVNCAETADGVVFQFKNGITFQADDPNMTSGVKNLIKNTVDRMVNGNININLNNAANPVSFEAV